MVVERADGVWVILNKNKERLKTRNVSIIILERISLSPQLIKNKEKHAQKWKLNKKQV